MSSKIVPVLLLVLFVFDNTIFAQSPPLVNFQAQVETEGCMGASLTKPVRFLLFNDPDVGDPIWEEQLPEAVIQNCLLRVVLGQTNNDGALESAFLSDGDRFLELRIDEEIIRPRFRLMSAPFAIRAQSADGLSATRQIGIGMAASEIPESLLDVDKGRSSGPHLKVHDWVDLSSHPGGAGLLGGNVYLENSMDENFFRYSRDHSGIGATGFAVNAPAWNKAGIFVNDGPASAAGGELEPNWVAVFESGRRVGIGTDDPIANLHIKPFFDVPIQVIDLDVNTFGTVDNLLNSYFIRGRDSNQTIFILRGDGSLGLGTGDPQARLDVNGDIRGNNFPTTSDLRYKKDIQPISDALALTLGLEGIKHNWNYEDYPEKNFNEGYTLGFVAQDVNKILPELVSIDKEGYYSVAYSKMVPLLVESIKEQQNIIEQQREQLEAYNARLERIERLMQGLE